MDGGGDAEALRVAAVRPSWAGSTFAAFRFRGYGALWLNVLFTTLGVVSCITTLFVVMADLTGTNRGVGGVTFALGVPMLLLGPVAGVLADRLSKRLVLLGGQAAMGAGAFVLGLLITTDLVSVPWVLGFAVVVGMCLSLLGPVQIAYMGSIVQAEGLGNATALFQASLNLTRVVGPFLVAGLVALPEAGTGGSMFLVSSLMAAAMLPLAAMPPSRPGGASVDSVLASLGMGLRHVIYRPLLRQLVIAFLLVTLIGFSYFVVLPRFAANVLGAGESGYGVMVGVSSIGGLVATVLIAPLADSPRVFTLLRGAAFGFGLMLIVTGLAPGFITALAAMVGVGAAASAFQALNNAAAYRAADPAYLGRITALMNLAWSLTNLAGLPVGLIADAAGERTTLAGIGTTLCALALLLLAWGGGASARKPVGPWAGRDEEVARAD
ncbi:MAG TPA: MFS transporter [Dehalococcoidia bacterium]|nr:MFS transporter [Dehalococcoidia bacterium]